MPETQNNTIKEARLKFLRLNPMHPPARRLDYTEYIKLLKALVAFKCSSSLLAAEMVLFANAPALARMFLCDQ